MSQYVHDLSEAALDDELLQSKEPVLVDFWAPWCGPCRAMSPAVEAAAQKLAGGARVYKVNVDDNPSVSPRFGIRGIPNPDPLQGWAGNESPGWPFQQRANRDAGCFIIQSSEGVSESNVFH